MRPAFLVAGAFLATVAFSVAADNVYAVPFNPVLSASLIDPTPSANGSIRLAVSLPPGDSTLSSWAVFVPNGWGINDGALVTDGDRVGRGTMSVDTNCDGSINTYGPFDLLDATIAQPPNNPTAEWAGDINAWWSLVITADSDSTDQFLTADMINLSQFHTLCAPQTFALTIFGRSSPHNEWVLSNPSSAGSNYTFTSDLRGGGYAANPSASVCVGTSCDYDADGVSDVTDNCPTWANPGQTLPWSVPLNDPDCDGFSSTVEDLAGAKALVHCGYNTWPADLNNDTFSDGTDITTIAGSFGKAVPPAPARHNIAPDPPDGFVDGTDITKIAGFFGKSCAPCATDLDCDAVNDALDNCPNWPNPAQNLPPWPVSANDPDCDGFSSTVETSAGTNAAKHCGNEAWPADLNNDTFSDVSDITIIAGSFGKAVPPAPARRNIAPDPVDGFVDGTDITKVAGFFGKVCS